MMRFGQFFIIQPLAAYLLAQQTLILSGTPFLWYHPIPVLLFAGAWIAYNSHQHISSVIVLLITVMIAFHVKPEISVGQCVLALLVGLTTAVYVRPGRFRINIRKIPGVKTILLTLVWTVSTALLPILSGNHSVGYLAFESILRFAFIFPVVLASDLDDVISDRQAGIITLPVLLSRKRICQLILISLTVFVGLAVYAVSNCYTPVHPYLLVAIFLVSTLVTAGFSLIRSETKKNYTPLLDMSVLAQGLLITLAGVYLGL
ncbi:MAG: hypothetical protein IT241_10765 [Bacteroidia bacterium]|nr:hypothetical protein [Bacteroidia bacterium]